MTASPASAVGFVVQVLRTVLGIGLFSGVCAWVFYAIVSGRGLKQRLTDPIAIDEGTESLVKA
jgi:hypothetical protein